MLITDQLAAFIVAVSVIYMQFKGRGIRRPRCVEKLFGYTRHFNRKESMLALQANL